MIEICQEIRIVIPAFNSGNTIVKCIDAVLKSIHFNKSWEIIIVDNGQNPDLTTLLKNYPVKILKREEKQSAAYARNEGAKGFANGILVFIDSDVICEENCLTLLIEPLQKNTCNATIGNYSKNIEGLSFSQTYKQLYINHIYARERLNIKNDFWTAICSIDAKIFNQLNGFNTNYKGAYGEDQEFGIRLTKNNYTVLSAKNANGQHLHSYGVFNIIRNDFKKGLIAVNNSLENNVPFSDNRHSHKNDILSVFFAATTIAFLILALVFSDLLLMAIASCFLWLGFRKTLIIVFIKNAGFVFLLKALLLMYILDLIRSLCVMLGFVKSILSKATKLL